MWTQKSRERRRYPSPRRPKTKWRIWVSIPVLHFAIVKKIAALRAADGFVEKIQTKLKTFIIYPAALCVTGRSRMLCSRPIASIVIDIRSILSPRPTGAEGRREGRCLHAPRPVWCQSARRSGVFLHRSARRRRPSCVYHSQTRAVAVGALPALKRVVMARNVSGLPFCKTPAFK